MRKHQPHARCCWFRQGKWTSIPSFLRLDIEAIDEKWLQAWNFYPMWRGQTGFSRYNDYYSSLSVVRGCLSGFKRAVALMSDPGQRMERPRSL